MKYCLDGVKDENVVQKCIAQFKLSFPYLLGYQLFRPLFFKQAQALYPNSHINDESTPIHSAYKKGK